MPPLPRRCGGGTWLAIRQENWLCGNTRTVRRQYAARNWSSSVPHVRTRYCRVLPRSGTCGNLEREIGNPRRRFCGRRGRRRGTREARAPPFPNGQRQCRFVRLVLAKITRLCPAGTLGADRIFAPRKNPERKLALEVVVVVCKHTIRRCPSGWAPTLSPARRGSRLLPRGERAPVCGRVPASAMVRPLGSCECQSSLLTQNVFIVFHATGSRHRSKFPFATARRSSPGSSSFPLAGQARQFHLPFIHFFGGLTIAFPPKKLR